MNYLVTNTDLSDVANKIRSKTGTTGTLTFPGDFKDEIDKLTNTADANATASDIVSGKTAYVNNVKVTGNVPTKEASDVTVSGNTVSIPAGKYSSAVSKTVGTSKAAATYNVSSSDQTIAAGQYLSGAQTLRAVTTANIDAGNIRKGVTVTVGDAASSGRIKNVAGSYEGHDFGLISLTFSKSSGQIGPVTATQTVNVGSTYYNLPDLATRTKLVVRGIGCSGSWSEFSSSVTKGSANNIVVTVSMSCTSNTGSFTLQVRPTYV